MHRFGARGISFSSLVASLLGSMLGLALCFQAIAQDDTRPVAGLHSSRANVHAFVDAKIVVGAQRILEHATMVVDDGVIVAVGEDVQVPEQAVRWDMTGKTIYPGLIDSYHPVETEAPASGEGAGHWNSRIHPQLLVSDLLDEQMVDASAARKQGVTVRLLAPDRGIVRGQSVAAATGGRRRERTVLRDQVALHLRLAAQRGGDGYPRSPMGAVALARQTFYDADWYESAWSVFRAGNGAPMPERNDALAALGPYVKNQQLVIAETMDEQYFQRADRFAREFGLRIVCVGSGHEYRRIDMIAETGRTVIVPLDFPKAPNVETTEAVENVTLERLMHWDHAPTNPARLHQAGVRIALTGHGLDNPGQLREAVRKAIDHGLPADVALRALTETPAQMLGIQQWVGTLEVGKLAHLVVTDGDLFAKPTKVLETWIDGERYTHEEKLPHDVRGTWQLTSSNEAMLPQLVVTGEVRKLKAQLEIAADDESEDSPEEDDQAPAEAAEDDESDENDGADEEDEKDAGDAEAEGNEQDEKPGTKSWKLKSVRLRGTQLTARFDADAIGGSAGYAFLSATLLHSSDEEAKLIGEFRHPDGQRTEFTGARVATPADASAVEKDDEPAGESESEDEDEDEDEDAPAEEDSTAPLYPVNYPLGAFGFADATGPEAAEVVVFRGATVWTCGEAGVLPSADVVVINGVIEQVVERLETLPQGATVVDAKGMHLTPGIIDCHSHMATDGGVNEGTQAITAEVRIGDFIDARDISIYRQLAGGVTSANILHGSANPIGGQNQVIKLRWGADSESLKFREAPAGIKFALGENVKQSNWGDRYTTRYPKSRMGVDELVRDAFLTARQYRRRHLDWQEQRRGLPPRRDLELDALVEIQEGQRWIHCHSYRQDEILALLRTLESFGIQIGTLQHILEGYKVAEAMKSHGAMASSFSDWWAYKIEVYDAIPYNGSIMHDAGIVVSFNSDDAELARHLNHEAAKATKYGGVPATEALKFVTLNPAKQLRIDHLVGTIEKGKQADLVLWSGPPLSNLSRCEQTWIDGRKYFDRRQDLEQRQQWNEMKAKLAQHVLQSGDPMEKETERKPEERELWPRVDIYCSAFAGSTSDK